VARARDDGAREGIVSYHGRTQAERGGDPMNRRRRPIVIAAVAVILAAFTHATGAPSARAEAPGGQMTWALHFTPAPTLLEPAETPGLITPFMFLYALHDALLKPMPGKSMAPSLAESWSVSPDGLVYEFVLRKAVKFHNDEPVTAEDVKFSLSATAASRRKRSRTRWPRSTSSIPRVSASG
jgi:ABC-type transport system substrate-binding protein